MIHCGENIALTLIMKWNVHFRDRATPAGQHSTNKKHIRAICSVIIKALTWFFGCDIDCVALRTHSSAVIGPQGHVIGAPALQVPDEDRSFIPHRPDDTASVWLLPLAPVLQLKAQQQF